MRAIVTNDRVAAASGLSLAEMPYPHAAENDVIVQVHAASFTPGELDWPATWTTGPGVTGRRQFLDTNCPGSSRNWVTAQPG